ncbi:hypothetical protein LZ575_18225 [Antarcticibacterium sp. 1MA-6-2]|uniref:hypothetical protein n=1 Tax=Antarcticibacterium sp. 1MA-6-2 TaxID=2908210 RepID=UPI001F437728|nr:hypothetical protein [Antarcticibacterium sp. 1MA-6-2]UJH90682.1 hypothetical protein LZ575_18225 [Antarcticibacterium sp. 1MA-6-2]
MKKSYYLLAILTAIILFPFLLKPDVGDMMRRSPNGNFSFKEYKFSSDSNVKHFVTHGMGYGASSDTNWKYVENRLFDGKTSRAPKLGHYILPILWGATKEDSLVIDGLVSDLKDLISNNNIIYAGDFTTLWPNDKPLPKGGATSILFNFENKQHEFLRKDYSQNGNEVAFEHHAGKFI